MTEQNINVIFDKYTISVFNKHVRKYGQNGAIKTRDRVKEIFIKAIKQTEDKEKNNNVLLIGKVQSGKTSNLEMFTAIAFDNGFRCVVIYGGYDDKLLQQTRKRFDKTFNMDDQLTNDCTPEIFATNDGKSVDAIGEDIIDILIESQKPLIFISMKRPPALNKVNAALTKLPNNIKTRTFIIDDEGDQASLNTEIKKGKDRKSATYSKIEKMKNILLDPLYLSVTATPQANVLLGEYSCLRPDSLMLIEPGEDYTGSDFFHLDESLIKIISQNDAEILNEGKMPSSLYKAIYYFIIVSALMVKRNIKYSDMIIHTSRYNKHHNDIYDSVYSLIASFKDNIKNNDSEIDKQIDAIKTIYNINYFSKEILEQNNFDDLKKDIKNLLRNNVHVILQDSTGAVTQEHEYLKKHKIYIGGDLLQRGLTFENLVVTYFTRWPKNNGNIDTTIQRARWLGYRSKFLDLCKLFTTEKIKKEYSGLTESENDLWEQCYLIQNNISTINDIVIDADSSTLNPTRRNVVNYRNLTFNKRWNNQKIGIFDINIIKKNNEIIDSFLSKLLYKKSSIGTTPEKISCLYSEISYELIMKLINSCDLIFDNKPFNKTDLSIVLKNKRIIIEKMFDFEEKDFSFRERLFDKDDNKIHTLHQGPIQNYLGDRSVIVYENAVIIQIFRVRPKFVEPSISSSEYDQYMFAFHIPDPRKGFIKNI